MRQYPNIHVSLYDGERDISFDCPDGLCKFYLGFSNPPEPDSVCSWNKQYTCVLPEARMAAMNAVARFCKTKKDT